MKKLVHHNFRFLQQEVAIGLLIPILSFLLLAFLQIVWHKEINLFNLNKLFNLFMVSYQMFLRFRLEFSYVGVSLDRKY